jgi:hypothetical protein
MKRCSPCTKPIRSAGWSFVGSRCVGDRTAIAPPAPGNRRLIIGRFPGKLQGGEAAFARVSFGGEWPANP